MDFLLISIVVYFLFPLLFALLGIAFTTPVLQNIMFAIVRIHN